MQLVIILALVYIVGMPIIFRLIALLHKKMVTERAMRKMGNTKAAMANMPTPIWNTWKERISFTMKDKRTIELGKKKAKEGEPGASMQNRQLFFLIWTAGLAIVIIGAFIGKYQIYLPGYLIFFFATGFGIHASKDLLEARKRMYTRMFEIGQQNLGISSENAKNPQAEVQVLDWSDPITPTKVQFNVPTTFSQSGEEGFMKQFNQVFGNETAWVPDDDPEQEKGMQLGWNYDKGYVRIRAVPPLPQMAPWDEHYILDPGIAWSFFPIALGVENGVEMPNPKSGEIENVLGFDVSGLQGDIGKKAGYKIGNEITTSPMTFVGGGTGGGKSLSVDTLVKILEKQRILGVF